MVNRIEIPAVRDRDLRAVLDRFGLSQMIDNGEVVCTSCDTDLTWDNLGALVVREGELQLFCELPDCIEVASERRR